MNGRGSPARPGSDLVARKDRLSMMITSGLLAFVFAAGTTVQSVLIFALTPSGTRDAAQSWATLGPRILGNGICLVLFVLLAGAAGLEQRRGASRIGRAIPTVILPVLVRSVLQAVLGLYGGNRVVQLAADFLAAALALSVCLAVGLLLVTVERRLREQELATVTQRLAATAALTALQGEELRLRREVAEGLHGTLQQRLVVISAMLEGIRASLASGPSASGDRTDPLAAATLERVIADVDRLRERDVRELSHLLYPAGVDIGLIQAARLMLARLPEQIAVDLTIGDAVGGIDDGPPDSGLVGMRILVMRVMEEAISNALRHGHATRLAVTLDADGAGRVVLTVDDDGTGLPRGENVILHGMGLLRRRLEATGGSLALGPGSLGGARMLAVAAVPAVPVETSSPRASPSP